MLSWPATVGSAMVVGVFAPLVGALMLCAGMWVGTRWFDRHGAFWLALAPWYVLFGGITVGVVAGTGRWWTAVTGALICTLISAVCGVWVLRAGRAFQRRAN